MEEKQPNRLWILLVLLGVIVALGWLVSYYTDWLWFKATAYDGIFWRSVKARFASGVFFGVPRRSSGADFRHAGPDRSGGGGRHRAGDNRGLFPQPRHHRG